MSENKQDKQVKNNKVKEPMIYIGPHIKSDFLLSTMTIVYDGVPSIVEKRKELKELFVPVSQLAKARQELKDPKSKLHKAYVDAKRKEFEVISKKEAR